MLDVLIKDAVIIDGTGSSAFLGNIGITEDKIVLVKQASCNIEALNVIDGNGLICCPGFIDIHSHADVTLPFYPEMYNLVVQGITTFVGGNCGIGIAPASNPDFYSSYFSSLGLGDLDVKWGTFREWLEFADRMPLSVNYAPLVGHNIIRGNSLGSTFNRYSTSSEIDKEIHLLEEAIYAGAFGMSISFDAGVPGHHADKTELFKLFKVLKDRNSLITAHTRHHQNQWPSSDGRTYYGVYNGYPGDIICGRYHGLIEFMEYCKRFPKLRTLISHLTNAFIMPQPHSQTLENAMIDETLHLFVDDPVNDGYDIYFNLLPSEISISSIAKVASNLMVSMYHDEYFKEYATECLFLKMLNHSSFRTQLIKFINSGKFKFGMICPATDPYWSNTFTFVRCIDKSIEGKTLLDITTKRKKSMHLERIYEDCLDVLFDIVAADPQVEWALTKDKREYMAYERLLLHSRSMPCTDVIAFPRVPDLTRNIMSYGTPPTAYSMMCRYLVNMSRDNKHLSLEEAIRKITSLPAEVMRIHNRGKLKTGYFADLTLFSLKDLCYQDDFANPSIRPEGIIHVIVNGQFAMKDGIVQTGSSGKVLRHE